MKDTKWLVVGNVVSLSHPHNQHIAMHRVQLPSRDETKIDSQTAIGRAMQNGLICPDTAVTSVSAINMGEVDSKESWDMN